MYAIRSYYDQVSARGRAKVLFGFDYVWEVYKPKETVPVRGQSGLRPTTRAMRGVSPMRSTRRHPAAMSQSRISFSVYVSPVV